MDHQLYEKYIREYVEQAIQDSDGSNQSIAEALSAIRVSGLLLSHKDERRRALADARRAFDEHRHWPRDIILSHLGVKL